MAIDHHNLLEGSLAYIRNVASMAFDPEPVSLNNVCGAVNEVITAGRL